MASIPGWAYAGAGAAIAIYSKFVQSRKPSTAIELFFWVGLALLAIGVFKLGARFIMGKKEEFSYIENKPGNARSANTQDFIICPKCNAKLHPQSRFCNWCGTRQ